MKFDYTIEEGGRHPVYHMCVVHEFDYEATPDMPCGCGVTCPHCSHLNYSMGRKHVKFYANQWGKFSHAQLVCSKCGEVMFNFRVRLW